MQKTTDRIPGMLLFMIAVVICGSLFERTSLKTDGALLTVKPGAKLVSVFGKDSIVTPLSTGEQVRVLGFTDSGIRMRYLVETSNGLRGHLGPWQVSQPVIPEYHELKGDSVWLENRKMADDLANTDYMPSFEGWKEMKLRQNAYLHYISANKFRKKAEGITMTKAEKEFGPITHLARNNKQELTALFSTAVFNPESGRFSQPVIHFGSDSVATTVSMKEASDRNDWLLSLLPFASHIYDLPLTSWIARTDLYDTFAFNKATTSSIEKAWIWTKRLTLCLFGLFWLFGTISIPAFFILWLLEFRRILFPLSDDSVQVVVAVLTGIASYYWMVLLMGWGAPFWMVALVIPAAIYMVSGYNRLLEG